MDEIFFPPEKVVLHILKNKPLNSVKEALDQVIVGEDANKLTIFLSKLSYIRAKPTHEIIRGESGGGKTHLAIGVLDVFPADDVVKISRVTPTWTDYSADELRHKIVFVQQFGGVESASDAFQILMSEYGLRLGTVKMTSEGWKSQTVDTTGPVSFLSTTTQLKIDSEMETRTFYITPDESTEQTEAIQDFQAYFDRFPWEEEKAKVSIKRIRKVVAFLRDEGVKEVVVPFSNLIKLPSELLSVRRDRPRLIELIKSLAMLRQMKREILEKAGTKCLVAEWEDYIDVLRTCGTVIAQSVQQLTGSERGMLNVINEWYSAGNCFTSEDINNISKMKLDNSTIRKRLNALAEKGHLRRRAGGGRGNPNQYSLMTGFENYIQDFLVKPVNEDEVKDNVAHWEARLGPEISWWKYDDQGRLVKQDKQG